MPASAQRRCLSRTRLPSLVGCYAIGYTLVLPFHDNPEALASAVERARREGPAHGIRETLLCHNGPPLTPSERASVEALAHGNVRLLHTDAKGLGAGYKLGIAEASEEHLVLSAADLPFGWSDVEAFEAAGKPEFAIGSKAHPDSRLAGVKPMRRVTSLVFRAVRVLALGRDTPGDSQGSLIVRTETARHLLPDLVYDHYLCSLELASLHLKQGGSVLEIPVRVENVGKSSVSVVRDGYRMARDVLTLRRRLRAFTPASSRAARFSGPS